MNICIRNSPNGEWTSSRIPPAMRDAYVAYKERPQYFRETPYIINEYVVYRIDNDPYLPTYIAKTSDIPELENGVGAGLAVGQRNNLANNITISRAAHELMSAAATATATATAPIPIIDMNDIYVFIVDNPSMDRANWLKCRDYQAWAFRDFMYTSHDDDKRTYMSPGSSYLAFTPNINPNNVTTINLPNLSPNIIFNISRNDNNSVYYERNDATNTRIRLCDNQYARAGYLGFYTRITMDPGMIVLPQQPSASASASASVAVYYAALLASVSASAAAPAPAGGGVLSTSHLSPLVETSDEQKQCILCFKYQINAKFSPCEHSICCSVCYSQLTVNKCPVCRADISRVMNV